MEARDVAAMMALLETAYPRFYANQSAEKMRAAVMLWAEALAEYPGEAVRAALVKLIKESPFPPVISDVVQRLESMKTAGADGIEEMWAKIMKALRNGYYGSQEEFDALPKECQRFIGTPSDLRQMSMMDEHILMSVTRGQFAKRAQSLIDQEKILRETPEHVLALMQGLADGWKMPDGNAVNALGEGS